MKKNIKITEQDIQNIVNDYWFIVEPIWDKGNIYRTYSIYENSIAKFSIHQKYLHATEWLISEVSNGGFDQLFYNSTGIVWKYAYKGFIEMNCYKTIEILDKVLTLYGKQPSEDREERWNEIENNPNWERCIDKLNSDFYSLEEYEEKAIEYIKSNAKDFMFEGEINID